jgi:hypothetical protein
MWSGAPEALRSPRARTQAGGSAPEGSTLSAPVIVLEGQAHREVNDEEQDHRRHQHPGEEIQPAIRDVHGAPPIQCRQPAPCVITLSILLSTTMASTRHPALADRQDWSRNRKWLRWWDRDDDRRMPRSSRCRGCVHGRCFPVTRTAPLRSHLMLDAPEVLKTALALGAVALIAAGFQTARNGTWRYVGRPTTMAIVGISFTLSAGVIAFVELPNTEQLPPARALRLQYDREEQKPSS